MKTFRNHTLWRDFTQGPHGFWKSGKTWKNGSGFSSQGIIRELLKGVKYQGKSGNFMVEIIRLLNF